MTPKTNILSDDNRHHPLSPSASGCLLLQPSQRGSTHLRATSISALTMQCPATIVSGKHSSWYRSQSGGGEPTTPLQFACGSERNLQSPRDRASQRCSAPPPLVFRALPTRKTPRHTQHGGSQHAGTPGATDRYFRRNNSSVDIICMYTKVEDMVPDSTWVQV